MSDMISIWVPGIPLPQGSKTGYARGGRVVLVELCDKKTKTRKAGGLKRWRASIAEAARLVAVDVWDCPVVMNATFCFRRPPSHFKADGASLRNGAPTHPGHRNGDLSKLVRAVEDALAGIVYTDDTRVVGITAMKGWSDNAGVELAVSRLEGE